MNSEKNKGTKKGTFISPIFYKLNLNPLIMEEKALRDINEEIILKLEQLNLVLEQMAEEYKWLYENEKKRSLAHSSRE